MSKARKRRVMPTSGAFIGNQWVSNYDLGYRDAQAGREPMGGRAMMRAALDTSPNRDEDGNHVLKNHATMPKTYYQGYKKGEASMMQVLHDAQLLAATKALVASVGYDYDTLSTQERVIMRDETRQRLGLD